MNIIIIEDKTKTRDKISFFDSKRIRSTLIFIKKPKKGGIPAIDKITKKI